MKLLRRTFLAAAGLAPALAVRAQERWQPNRPIQMIVAFAAGGGTDVAARTIARFMERYLGQPVVVVNRPGAGGEIGFAELARAKPDGTTIGFINAPHIVTLPIERRTRFALEDFSLIANIVDDPSGFFARAGGPIRSLDDLVKAAKAKPGDLPYGSTGIGSDDHLAALAFERAAGVSLLHVPFTGTSQIKTALLGGQIELASANLSELLAEARQGQVVPLGQMAERRWESMTEVPTFRELGYDIVEGAMRGLAAPSGTPHPVLERLAEAVHQTVEDPEFRQAAEGQAMPLRFLGLKEYATELRAQRVKYQGVWDRTPWKE
jgi:tripartite-type tricarboxylate transporter receptor subunit TctC